MLLAVGKERRQLLSHQPNQGDIATNIVQEASPTTAKPICKAGCDKQTKRMSAAFKAQGAAENKDNEEHTPQPATQGIRLNQLQAPAKRIMLAC